MKTPSNSIKIIWFFLSQYKLQIILLLFSSLLVGVFEAATIAAVYPILGSVFEGINSSGNVILSLLYKTAKLLPVEDAFISFCLLFILFAIVAFVVRVVSIRYRVTFGARLVERQQNTIFSKFVQADYHYFIDSKEGELIYNTSVAPQGLSRLITSTTELVTQIILSVSVLSFLFSLSWQGMMVVLGIGLVYYVFTRYIAQKISYQSGWFQLEAIRESNVVLNETIAGIKQIKVFAVMNDRISKYSNAVNKIWAPYIRNYTWQQSLPPILMLILYIFIGLIAIMIRVIAPNSFSALIPVFGTFAFAVFRMVPSMSGITNSTMQIMNSLPNCETVYDIINEQLAHIEDGEKILDTLRSRIEFDNVDFAYRGRKKVLKGVSMTFEKGKTTAIVGRSGSGKTTVINLLLRLFDVDSGEISVDGTNIKQYKSASYLRKIGYVGQETVIFNDSIRNNIAFGREYRDEDIKRVSEYADAHSFITDLPDCYDTHVGDKGLRLSGGQRQRIAVARAMIREPEILIFDEATNALDNISEAAVQNAIDEIAKDHTVIIIAHRLSTIVNADKIIVLGDGKVQEEGNHNELMENRGIYWKLYNTIP